jgi:ubiquitin-activating enzyme E1
VFREVEGMTELNSTKPIKIIATTVFTITLDIDSTSFGDYVRQGVVENIKVAKTVPFHSWADSFKNPAGSSQYGMLETPDLSKFGRSEQLHAALIGIIAFVNQCKRYPETADVADCLGMAKVRIATLQKESKSNIEVEIEEPVFAKAVQWSASSISPMAAFFGGFIAQEIVKFTGKYTPLKQWLHFDIYETLPREENVNRVTTGTRYDD